MDCSCVQVYMAVFSSVADGTTAERQIQNRIFWLILYQFKEG